MLYDFVDIYTGGSEHWAVSKHDMFFLYSFLYGYPNSLYFVFHTSWILD